LKAPKLTTSVPVYRVCWLFESTKTGNYSPIYRVC